MTNHHTACWDVAIVGGGLAGLAAAIQLRNAGHRVVLMEKYYYPFHRVCGEYVSEESRPFLASLGIPFNRLDLPVINKLVVSAPDGSLVKVPLVPGGFGISRYRLDAMLAACAKEAGVQIMEGTRVQDIRYEDGMMRVSLPGQILDAKLVIGSFGKRSNLDLKWNRPFVRKKHDKLNNYIAVKYHVRAQLPADTIALHNFRDGYCGFSRIEEGLFCLCYLTTAQNLSSSNNSIPQMEKNILCANPCLEELFGQVEMVWKEPLSISQISFSQKEQLQDHVLLAGDAAGLITPLCGNGMSMALHAAKLLFNPADAFLKGHISRQEMEHQYTSNWHQQFAGRLRAGRIIQGFFGDPWLTKLLIGMTGRIPRLAGYLIRQTHGETY